eukprot:m.7377 g.7377  ORF g.7377 m.7377 type:complete len:416 (+) comp5193_c0_seq2:206-1453(+)
MDVEEDLVEVVDHHPAVHSLAVDSDHQSTVYSLSMYNVIVNLPQHYNPPDGSVALGAFGTVVFSRDQRRPCTPVDDYFEGHTQQVAIKKFRRFESADEAMRAYREVLILQHLQHENIIALRDFFVLPAEDGVLDYYMVTERGGTTLDQAIEYLTDTRDVLYIAYFILCGLKYIHSAGLAHRDLKPNNILVDDGTAKIIDFGYSKRDQGSFPYLQPYMQCRDYRAPELFLWLQANPEPDDSPYISGQQLDMWSFGVIVTEMMVQRALFPRIPSADGIELQHNHHMCRLFHHLGAPPVEYFMQFPDSRARDTLIQYASRVQSQFLWDELEAQRQANPDDPTRQDIIPLSRSLLTFSERPSAEQVLEMPFFASLHCAEDEVVASVPFDDTFETHRADADKDYWEAELQRLAEEFKSKQ